MSTFFPQINDNLILTQVPYQFGSSWQNLTQPLETGMCWSFPLIGSALPGFPSSPLGKFNINFSSITDSEINALYTFFTSMQGRFGQFSLLDPAGNLLQISQDFTQSYWSKTLSVTYGASDIYGHPFACSLSGGSMVAVVGPSTGGMSGFVMCASIWLKASGSGITATIGFKDASTSILYTKVVKLPYGSWLRISSNLVLPTNNQFLFYLSLSGNCAAFGAQVSPMKGEGAYAATPQAGNYGYHQNCRFDTDVFAVPTVGPNQNQVVLPCVEFNG